MQRRLADGEPEAVFVRVQDRLQDMGVTPNLVDPVSITILFDMEIPGNGVSRFFLAVVPSGKGRSDVALARRSNDKRKAMKAMVLSEDDPIEKKVLQDLLTPAAN
ncbi:MAG TPA: hypothetical protein VJ300_00630 [Thermoplasmata archaeon]|nr:hypothetical protein [Thermoplasmata archaeon]